MMITKTAQPSISGEIPEKNLSEQQSVILMNEEQTAKTLSVFYSTLKKVALNWRGTEIRKARKTSSV